MKRLLAIIVLSIATSAFAGLTYKFESSTTGIRTLTMTGTVSTDGQKMRMDVVSGDQMIFKDNDVVLSVDGGKTMTVFDPTTKTYFDLQLDQLLGSSTGMLNTLVRNSALDRVLDATISVDTQKIFKPAPEAYRLIESTLRVPPAEVLFVSSNPWDACGAKAFGLNVAWIERVTPEAMALVCVKSDVVAPLTMFKAIRTQMDELGLEPDYRIHALSELPDLVASHEP